MGLYALLQALTLLACWSWFAGLWTVAFFGYTLQDIEWWLLVASACAGLYGLRPNLERAIDTAWLKGIDNSKALADRVAELRPVKRRIDLIFSVAVLVILLVATLLWVGGLVRLQAT
jgi:hypothetical protein